MKKVKNDFKLLITLLVIITLCKELKAQSSSNTNIWTPVRFLGYNASNGVNPLEIRTNNIFRVRLNGTQNATINTVLQNVDGYFGIGPNGYFAANSPVCMLHLQGPDNSGFGSIAGWRKWMKTGTFTSENSDAMYVGMKNEGPGVNRSDAIINWSDDSGAGGVGADKLRFIFTNPVFNPTSLNPLTPMSLPGYEYMRLVSSPNQTNSTGAPAGNVGIGPVFTDLLPPTNRLHINAEENLAVFMQISNQNGTGQTVNDGLQVGYAPTTAVNKEAEINQKENDRLALYANNGERMRIMQTGALNNGIAFNPGALPANLTRIGISEDPAQPVTRPLSLLHIGYNTIIGNDGWRPWMDIGMYASKLSDNMYIGLKAEPGIGGTSGVDRQDAVINWGDNEVSTVPTNGPERLRFIFTSLPTGGGGTPPATLADGLEGGRMFPTTATGVFTGFGGDPTPGVGNPYASGGIDPTNTLEVNSWGATTVAGGSSGLRFTNLNTASPTTANPGTGVLAVNASGDVIYVPGNLGTGIGNYCAATLNPLTADYQIPMADHNYHFSDNGSTAQLNNVGIGTNCVALTARLQVVNPVMDFGIDATTSSSASSNVGVRGTASNGSTNSFGVFGQAITSGTVFNTGVYGHGANSGQTSYGGQFVADGFGTTHVAVQANANNGSFANYGVIANSNGGNYVYGVFGSAHIGTTANYGIYGDAAPSTGVGTVLDSYAGFFNGDVYHAGTFYPSDITVKQSIDSITNALGIIEQLHPKTYQFNPAIHPRMSLPTGLQYGLISQEVETVLPTLVRGIVFPPQVDSTGTIIDPSFQIKGLNYEQLIPILIKGIQEQQRGIDSLKQVTTKQDSINTSLQNQINQLTSIINACCNNRSMLQGNNSTAPSNSTSSLDVNLKDGQTIVLEQNVPNPFAEQTTINYFLPDNVVKAEMLFYNAQGKLIQSVDLNERGKGSLNVFASDLSNGIYTYTLVVDGKIIETKKMMKQQ